MTNARGELPGINQPIPLRPAAGREGLDPAGHVPPPVLRQEAREWLVEFLNQEGPNRWPGQAGPAQRMQTLPGISLPTEYVMALNVLTSHPATPYGHDRATAHRDLLVLGMQAMAQALIEMGADDDGGAQRVAHVIRYEQNLRRLSHQEETGHHILEDLAALAAGLAVRMQVQATEEIYIQLGRILNQVAELEGGFWRSLLQRLVFNVPEVRQAMRYLRDTDYALRPDFEAWEHIQARAEEQR